MVSPLPAQCSFGRGSKTDSSYGSQLRGTKPSHAAPRTEVGETVAGNHGDEFFFDALMHVELVSLYVYNSTGRGGESSVAAGPPRTTLCVPARGPALSRKCARFADDFGSG